MAGRLPPVATKARHLKTPLQLWIADNRKRLGLEPVDLARLTGVTEATVRGWESRGRPSEDAIAVLERRFGVAAPRGDQAVGTDLSELAASIRDLAQAIEAERAERLEWERGILSALLELGRARDPRDDPEPVPLGGAGR
jgi:transcriptional regulator with XRE-family HTH domain